MTDAWLSNACPRPPILQALHVLPYGGATCESLQDTLKHASCSLDMAQCSFPGNAAQQWQEGQKLAKGLEAHRISMETFTLWIRGALAVSGARIGRWGYGRADPRRPLPPCCVGWITKLALHSLAQTCPSWGYLEG